MESCTRGTWSISDHYWLWSNKCEKKEGLGLSKELKKKEQYPKSLVPPESYKEEKNLGGWKYSFRNEILILRFCLA